MTVLDAKALEAAKEELALHMGDHRGIAEVSAAVVMAYLSTATPEPAGDVNGEPVAWAWELEHELSRTYFSVEKPVFSPRDVPGVRNLRPLYTHPQSSDRELAAEVERLTKALNAINDIRNSIIGLQTINWSEHIYPLVAALDGAGIEGMAYPEARGQFGTMLERTKAAERTLEQARKVLEPFAALYDESTKDYPDGGAREGRPDDRHAWGFNNANLLWGDFRRARTALSQGGRDGR